MIYSYHFKPPEKMYVRFKTIDIISAHRLRDDHVLRITGAESDIADRIMRDPSVIEDGLRITDREKQTRSGTIDLYGVDRDHTRLTQKSRVNLCNLVVKILKTTTY